MRETHIVSTTEKDFSVNNDEYLERLTRTGPKRLHCVLYKYTDNYCQNSTHTKRHECARARAHTHTHTVTHIHTRAHALTTHTAVY